MELKIKEILKSKKMTQADLAEQLGMHPVNLSRILNNKVGLNKARMEQIAAALEVTVQELFAIEDGVRTVKVRGFVQAGEWAESWHWEDEDCYEVPVPDDPELRACNLFGAEARGPSMNRRYPEGTVLVFTEAIETAEDIVLGKRYIVERERADGLREATVKLLWQDESGIAWLLPESDDPRFQEPIEINGAEGDTIRIIGRVRFAVSRE